MLPEVFQYGTSLHNRIILAMLFYSYFPVPKNNVVSKTLEQTTYTYKLFKNNSANVEASPRHDYLIMAE